MPSPSYLCAVIVFWWRHVLYPRLYERAKTEKLGLLVSNWCNLVLNAWWKKPCKHGRIQRRHKGDASPPSSAGRLTSAYSERLSVEYEKCSAFGGHPSSPTSNFCIRVCLEVDKLAYGYTRFDLWSSQLFLYHWVRELTMTTTTVTSVKLLTVPHGNASLLVLQAAVTAGPYLSDEVAEHCFILL